MTYFMNKYYNEDKIYRYLDELCWRPSASARQTWTSDVSLALQQNRSACLHLLRGLHDNAET